MKKRKYKFMAQLDIFNKYLPSPIIIIVGGNTCAYIDKYFENKIIKLCQRYNYNGYLDICIKYIRGSKNIIYKTFYVYKDRLIIKPKENILEE